MLNNFHLEERTRLTLAPDRVPEPQSPNSAVPVFGTLRGAIVRLTQLPE